MCCSQHTYRVCFVRTSVYSVKWNRTRRWIKDQEAEQAGEGVSWNDTTRLKTAVGLHLKNPLDHTTFTHTLALTHTHSCRPRALTDEYECLCLAESEDLGANDRCINLMSLSLDWISKTIKQRKSCFCTTNVFCVFFCQKTSCCGQSKQLCVDALPGFDYCSNYNDLFSSSLQQRTLFHLLVFNTSQLHAFSASHRTTVSPGG